MNMEPDTKESAKIEVTWSNVNGKSKNKNGGGNERAMLKRVKEQQLSS